MYKRREEEYARSTGEGLRQGRRMKRPGSQIRVLMVISQFHPLIGGAENQARLLGSRLVEKGVRVCLLTGWWRPGTRRHEEMEGIRVFRHFSCWGMFGIKGLRPLGTLVYMITLALYLIIHRREYDLIHVHQALYPAFVSALVGKSLLTKPIIVKSASSGATSDIILLESFPLGHLQLRYLVKKMDCLVSVNHVSVKEYSDIGVPESKIVWIPNGVMVRPEVKRVSDLMKHVVTITRLSREKGVDVLLEAWAQLTNCYGYQDLSLTIVGDGPLREQSFKLSQELTVGESVTFLGMIEDISHCLEKGDLFVLPSRSEGMSNALLEAMSYGLPCIATKVGGNSELLKGDGEIEKGGYLLGENGVLVNPEDPEGLAKAIVCMIQNPEMRKRLAQKGQKFVAEHFGIDIIAERYIQLYKRVLESRA